MTKSVSATAGQAIHKRILVAEDNKVIQDLVSRFLKQVGFVVVTAENGIEALAVFEESYFDLVLTDYKMPIMDGFCLAGHVKERSPRTPVILLTGSDKVNVLQKMKTGPVDSVVFKPFKLEDLQRTIQGALTSKESEYESVMSGDRSWGF